MKKLMLVIILMFGAISAETYDNSYFDDRHGGAAAGLTLRIIGMALDYGVSLPLALSAVEKNENYNSNYNDYESSYYDEAPDDGSGTAIGSIVVGYIGGALQLGGDITAGVASSRAYATSVLELGLAGPSSTWGYFGGGIVAGLIGSVVNLVDSDGDMAGLSVSCAIVSDVLLTMHCIRAVKVTKSIKAQTDKKYSGVSIGIQPLVIKRGGGLQLALKF